MMGNIPASEIGSTHAGELEYVFETLSSKPDLPWTKGDFGLSDVMSSYWTNFVKAGDPNSKGLPFWPQMDTKDGYQVMHLSGRPPGCVPCYSDFL